MKTKLFTIIMALMLMVIPGAFAVETQEVNAGLTPNSPFYFIDRWVEGLNLAFTFNDGKKAVKHLEIAKERLSEMQEINESEEIEDLQLNYAKNLKKSREHAASVDFSATIDEFEKNNQEVLKQLREKLPEESQKAIENAINQSQNAKTYTEEEKQQHRIANQNMMQEQFFEEFEGNTFKLSIGDLETDGKVDYYYYTVANDGFIESDKIVEDPDYEIKVKNQESLNELYQKYISGEKLTYSEVTEVFDVPLRLQGKLVSIVGIGGLN